ncbi:hypothetical protein [Leisingera caerulea]|uniref:hypothetical protein n=1 Tax=Leisingera caerulea TaxID=506591 RepID=UPI0012B59F20|nr:hypothetical protein [Leisingera caerulea]
MGEHLLLSFPNKLLVIASLCLGSFTMTVIFRVAPWLFWISFRFLILRTLIETVLWLRCSPEQRQLFSTPGRLMNYNHSLSVPAEWTVMCFAFWGTLKWIGG